MDCVQSAKGGRSVPVSFQKAIRQVNTLFAEAWKPFDWKQSYGVRKSHFGVGFKNLVVYHGPIMGAITPLNLLKFC